ncbi:transglutaminase-like cysteine peptidase [Salinicola aestuarinus]|uniref:transglutaminase-like cysteine peptidase n=1 Tax=Salinicola aestuarinus TaxID=1949082 RepID=UPI001300BEDD|nr:transglutaminase-like cysteine peptidase [Salinicola aestuarinus]
MIHSLTISLRRLPSLGQATSALIVAAGLLVGAPAQAFTYWDDPTASAVTLSRADFIARAGRMDVESRLVYVNRVLNNAARQREETEDVWKGFDRLIADGYGDCEDFAIAKYQILLAAGTASDRLDLLAAHDTLTPTYHAVLRYRRDDGSHWILDNLTPLILKGSERRDLEPIVAFDRDRAKHYRNGAFHAVDPARIVLGDQPLAERMPKLLDY